MGNQIKAVQLDFSVDKVSGEAYISQRATAKHIGVSGSMLRRWIDKNRRTLNLNEDNQLSCKSLQKAVLMAQAKGSESAFALADKLMEAGAKAFIYYQAGHSLTAAKPALAQIEDSQQLKLSQDRIQKMIENPEAATAKQKHDLYMEWVDFGWVEVRQIPTTRNIYKITEEGKDFLYCPESSKAIRLQDGVDY